MNNTWKKTLVVGLIAVMLVGLSACSGKLSVIGKWNIQSISAGGMEMTAEDFKEFGISSGGFLRLRKSGKCDLDIIGDEYEGTWSMNDKGEISLKYNKGKLTATATVKDGVMTMTDSNGSILKLKK